MALISKTPRKDQEFKYPFKRVLNIRIHSKSPSFMWAGWFFRDDQFFPQQHQATVKDARQCGVHISYKPWLTFSTSVTSSMIDEAITKLKDRSITSTEVKLSICLLTQTLVRSQSEWQGCTEDRRAWATLCAKPAS